MERFSVAVLVNNQFGVLNRVTSMFRRRQFNIASLTVSETESSEVSRITVVFDGEKLAIHHGGYSTFRVISIEEIDSATSVSRELLLIKMENTPDVRDEIRAAADAFNAKTIDYTRESMVFQLTADSRRIDDFINLMRDYTILEICRTGIVSLSKGASTIRKVTLF